MNYSDFLKQRRPCPFCNADSEIIATGNHAYVTYSLAPYHKDHLLFIPHRHIENYDDLTEDEEREIQKLVRKGVKILEKRGHNSWSLLLRQGNASDKSIPHLHYHLIPTIPVTGVGITRETRQVLSTEESGELRQELKSDWNTPELIS